MNTMNTQSMVMYSLEPGDGTRYDLIIASGEHMRGGSPNHLYVAIEANGRWSGYVFYAKSHWGLWDHWAYVSQKLGVSEYTAAMVSVAVAYLQRNPGELNGACEAMAWCANTEFLLKDSIVASSYPLVVCEWNSGFEIVLANKGNVSHWMSDGVDMFTNEYGGSVDVGSDEWYEYLREWIKDTDELMEAYFPEME